MLLNRYTISTPPTNIPREDHSLLSLFKKENNDRNLFNSVDSEIIKLSGSEIILFKYHPSEDFDEVYQESRQKVISKDGIQIYGHYDPRAIEENLTQFGLEVTNDQVFVFNKNYIIGEAGRPIIPGDILMPSFQNIKFEVFEVQESSFEAYGIYHLLVHAKLLRDTEEIHDEGYFDRTDDIGGKV